MPGAPRARSSPRFRGSCRRAWSIVPAHPLAGSEKAGAEHGRADLFQNRVTVVVVSNFSAVWERTVAVGRFWEALGSRVVLMNADEHDRTVAITSHLPHAVATRGRGRDAAGLAPAHGRRLPRRDPHRGRRPATVGRDLPGQPRRDARRARPRSPTDWPSSERCSKPATAPGLMRGSPKGSRCAMLWEVEIRPLGPRRRARAGVRRVRPAHARRPRRRPRLRQSPAASCSKATSTDDRPRAARGRSARRSARRSRRRSRAVGARGGALRTPCC